MNLLPVFNQILVLFFILLIGFIVYRLRVVDDKLIDGISRLIIDVTLPALLITSMNFDFSREIFLESGQLILLSLILYLLSWGIAVIVTKRMKISNKLKDIFQFMLIFSNVGFMGYPVINAIYGRTGIFYAAIFNFTYGLLVWTLGVWIFRRNQGESFSFHWKVLLTPGMAAILLGFIFFVLSFRLPSPIYHTLEILGSTTTPLSMLIIGALIGRAKFAAIWSQKKMYFISVIRLIILPLLTLLLMLLLGFRGTILGTTVVLVGMPAAANTAIFAGRYGGDAELGAMVVFITTLFSIMTIPGLVFLLQFFNV